MVFRDLGFLPREKVFDINHGEAAYSLTETTYRFLLPHFLLFKLPLFSFDSSNDISRDNKKLPLWMESKRTALSILEKK